MKTSNPKIVTSILLSFMGLVSGLSNFACAQTAGAVQSSSAKAQPVNFDLSSSTTTMRAGSSGTINEGAASLFVKAGDNLTPAQYAALTQVLAGQNQSLRLDSAGRAIGGSFSLSLLPGIQLGSLLVPSHVTVMGAQNANSLSLAGSLLNNGNLLAVPTNSSNTFILNAASIQNNLGASISSMLAQTLSASAAFPVNLNIHTLGNLVNMGSITSGGVLSINAGGSIINGIPGQASSALMSGVMGTNLNSAIGNIVNTGTISSQLGNINISTAIARDLNLNNTLGLIQAKLANVNIENLSQLSNKTINITGGTIEAQSIAFDAKEGIVNAFLNELRAPVDISACAAHLAVSGGSLTLRNLDLSGDPSFVNSNGDITLLPNAGASLRFAGQDLAILASGDVIAGAGLSSIDLSSPSGGGNLFFSAGLQVSPGTGGATLQEPPVVPGGYTLGGPSASGGSVRLAGVSINTSASNPGARGGNVTIIAHDNDNVSQGTFGAGDKGFVQVGSINTSSAAGTGGSVFLVAQSDNITINTPILAAGASSDLGGSVAIIAGEPVANNLVFVNGTQQAGGSVSVNDDAGHDSVPINVSGAFDPASTYGDIFVNASGNLTLGNGSNINGSGSIQLFSRAGALSTGTNTVINANGGQLAISAATLVDLGSNTTFFSRDNFSVMATNGDVTGGGGHDFSCQGNMSFTAVNGSVSLGNAATNTLRAEGEIDFEASNQINLPGNNQINSGSSFFAVAGNTINIGSGQITAGVRPFQGDLGVGGVFLICPNNLQNGANLQSQGLDIMLASNNASVQLSNGSSYTANNGNVLLFSAAQINGSNNTFASDTGNGGGIEVFAGYPFPAFAFNLTSDLTTNALAVAALTKGIYGVETNIKQYNNNLATPFTAPATNSSGIVTNPAIMGNNVHISNNGINVGLVKVTSTGGGVVDVSGSDISTASGAVFFNASGAGAQINLTNAKFNTSLSLNPNPNLNAGSASPLTTALVARDLGILIPELNDSANSNTNLNSARLTLIQIVLKGEDSKRASGDDKKIEQAMGLLGNTIFDSKNFRGFDTGRIDISKAPSPSPSTSGTGAFHGMTFNAMAAPHGQAFVAQFQPINIFHDNGAVIPPTRVSEQRSDLVLFTSAGQVLSGSPGGSQGGNAIGARGTTVSDEKDALLLHGGKMYANSGNTPMKVVTAFGTIILAPQSSAAVEVDVEGGGRILVINGKNEPSATLEAGGNKIALNAGEQIRVQVPNNENAQGISRGSLIKERVPVSNLAQKENEGYYSKRSIRLGGNLGGSYRRMLEAIDNWSGPAGDTKQTTASTASSSGAGSNSMHGAQPAHVLAAAGTIYQQETDTVLSIKLGSMFIRPNTEQTIKTVFGDLVVEAGAGAEVEVRNGQVRFRSYSGPGKVRAVIANQKMLLAPGQELVMQRQKATREEALPHDGIARRSLEHFVLPNGINAVTGEFSIVSSIQAEQHLNSLRSSEKKQNKVLKADMLKTAASLSIVRGARGRYFLAPTEKSRLPDDAFLKPVQPETQRVSYADQ